MAVNFLFVSRLFPHLLDTCRLLVACLLDSLTAEKKEVECNEWVAFHGLCTSCLKYVVRCAVCSSKFTNTNHSRLIIVSYSQPDDDTAKRKVNGKDAEHISNI